VLIAATLVWWQVAPPPTEVTASASTAGPQRSSPLPGLLASALVAGLAAWFFLRLQSRAARGRESRTQLQALCDLLDVWQWQTDAQHRLVLARPPSGSPASDWATVAPPRLLWEHFRAADEASLRAQMSSAASLHDVDVWRTAPDGGARPGRLRGRALSDAAGAFAGYVGTLRDGAGEPTATARNAEPSAPVAAASATARAPARLESDAEHESFSYTVSHDLRAPIRVVEGFTKIVKEDYGSVLDRVGHDHLDRVLGAAARMNSMIDALLALSRLSSQPLARQPVNLSQLAGFVADDLRRQWPEHPVAFEVMRDMQVLGDPTLLRVVLENLLGNAWKYTAHCSSPQIWFEHSVSDPAAFTLRDNGAGFDMRFADRLFGVFQRLHSASEFPGTGVGLASVRRIIRRHGGEIWAEAELDRGARFHFTLPQGDMRR
jgi:signal transduction histidine kinase